MTPTTAQELADHLASAAGPIRIEGGATRVLHDDAGYANLSTKNLTGITLYEPGAMTMVVQAGTPLSEIEQALQAENQRLAFEPPDLRDVLGTTGHSTIGGICASNASGPRRIMVGACRDFMLGVQFVDGTGRVIRNGGRVMKNVTGYDLVKLMAGSYGTLGVLSEVALKVTPCLEMQSCLILDGLTPERAVAAMSRALGSPFEVSGAAQDVTGRVLLRLEGFEASVRYRTAQLTALLAEFGTLSVEEDQDRCTQSWRDLRDARAFTSTEGALWRISVKPSDAPALLEALEPSMAQLDWGGGLIWAALPEACDPRAQMRVPGHATLMRGDFNALPRFHPEAAPLAAISAKLRAQFDPKTQLNPGLMGPHS